MSDITKIKVADESESSYKLSPINEEFAKRVDSADGIGVQSDWNEEDETSPAFILNKPESLGGGYAYYSLNTSINPAHLGRNHEPVYRDGDPNTTLEEFEATYKTKPILLVLPGESNNCTPCLAFYTMSKKYYVKYYDVHTGNYVSEEVRLTKTTTTSTTTTSTTTTSSTTTSTSTST